MRVPIPKSKGIYFTRDFLNSEAYWKLNGTAIKILNIFYLKRVIVKNKRSRRNDINVINNGEIIFTCVQAMRYGFTKNTFYRARNRLIETGFIKINEPGGNNIGTTYYISNRWERYPDESWPVEKPDTYIGRSTRFVKKHPQK